MKVNVIVCLKEAVHDPQGETISGVLKQMGYGKVAAVRQGKFFEIALEAGSREEGERLAKEIAARVLSNPVLEVFEVEVKG
jgi:phosphoribosylformylglycinamidine synthase subunit PurS